MDPRAPHSRFALAEGDPAGIQVLRYHLPGQGSVQLPRSEVERTEGELARQIELLDRWGFTLITFGDYRLYLKGDLHLPRKPLILTFDDCIRQVHEMVLPVLRDDGARAVVFAVTGSTPASTGHEAHRTPGGLPFDPEHLIALHEAGCEIGSLTCTNRPLPFLACAAMREELTLSKKILEGLIGEPVVSLAYPSDLVSPEAKRQVAESGFEFAVCGAARSTPFGNDLFEIRRHSVRPTTGTLGLAMSAFAPVARLDRLRLRSIPRFGREPDPLQSGVAQ